MTSNLNSLISITNVLMSLWHLLVIICYLKRPLKLLMASEVIFDLVNELRELDYLCSSAYILLLSLKRLFSPWRRKEKETRKQN